MPRNQSNSRSRINQSAHDQEIILEEFDCLAKVVLPGEINLIATHCSDLLLKLSMKKNSDSE